MHFYLFLNPSTTFERLGVQSTMYYTAQETGNGTLVMMHEGGGSNTEQEGGTDPFPVVGWRSAAL